MQSTLPSQTIPQFEKTPEWCKKHLDYSEFLLQNYSYYRTTMDRMYQSYNGIKPSGALNYITKRYGKDNKTPFVPYRLGRTKMNLLHGEQLKRPLSATVETTNSEAKSEKMKQFDFMTGAMIAKDEIGAIQDKVGVDIMNGAPIPQNEADPVWDKMSVKDKCEDIMQVIINDQIKELDLVKKFADNFLDVGITSCCWGKIEIDEQGNVDYIKYDPRDKISEEVEGDDFYEKSSIKGGRQRLPLHQVLLKFDFTEDERKLLESINGNPKNYKDKHRGFVTIENGQTQIDVIHINWKSVKPRYFKLVPKKIGVMDFNVDSEDDFYWNEINAEKYEKNKDFYETEAKSKGCKIVAKYMQDEWEATRIAGCVDKNMRRKPFQMRKVDSAAYILDSSYVGFKFGTVDGIRISMQQLIENFDNQYDVVQYQINKELARAKGVVIVYDRAGLPKKRNMTDIMHQMINDGYIDIDTSAAGNFSGRNLENMNIMKQFDLGLSNTFQMLLSLKQDITSSLDKITGINENREGMTPASATATNSQSNIELSRTITEPMFYNMNLFVEKTLMKIAESTKVSWAFYKLDKGEQILGSAKFKFMQVTEDIGFRDYGVHVQDGGRYNRLMAKLDRYYEAAINAKAIGMSDFLKLELSETFSELKNTAEDAEARINQIAQEQQERQLAAQNQMNQQQLQTNVQISTEDREDRQQHDLQKIGLETQGQMMIDDNRAKNKSVNDQQKSMNKIIQGV